MDKSDLVFEYLYRDGGNFKTCGKIRLSGTASCIEQNIRDCLEWGDQFVAEQVGIPSLCEAHWDSVEDGPSDLDHAYHEFCGLRNLDADEQKMPVWGSLGELASRMQGAARKWDVSLSPNVDL